MPIHIPRVAYGPKKSAPPPQGFAAMARIKFFVKRRTPDQLTQPAPLQRHSQMFVGKASGERKAQA